MIVMTQQQTLGRLEVVGCYVPFSAVGRVLSLENIPRQKLWGHPVE